MRLEASAIVDGGRAPSDAPGATAKRVFALEGLARTLVESAGPLRGRWDALAGREPVLVAFPGAALGALPPSTMGEDFGLKGCVVPRRKIQRPGECCSGGMTSKYVTELPKQTTKFQIKFGIKVRTELKGSRQLLRPKASAESLGGIGPDKSGGL